MGFDKNTEGQPVVQAEKKTTKVNIWMVVGVLVFMLLGLLALVHVHNNPPQNTHDSLPAAKSGTGT